VGGAPTGGGIDLVISEVSPVHFAVSCFIELTSMAMTFTNKRRIFFSTVRDFDSSRERESIVAAINSRFIDVSAF
jgi:hypothetical protein